MAAAASFYSARLLWLFLLYLARAGEAEELAPFFFSPFMYPVARGVGGE